MPGDALAQKPKPDSLPGRDHERRRMCNGVGFLSVYQDDGAGYGGGIAGGHVSARIADVVQVAKLDQFIELLGGRRHSELLSDHAGGVEINVAHGQSVGIGIVGKDGAFEAGLDVVFDNDHAVHPAEECVARQHVRVKPEDARTERLELIGVALARKHCVLRDRGAIAVVIQFDAVPVDAGAFGGKLVHEMANHLLADLQIHHQDRDAGAGWRHGPRFVLIDKGMHRRSVDGDVSFDRGDGTLENVRIRIHIHCLDEIGFGRWS